MIIHYFALVYINTANMLMENNFRNHVTQGQVEKRKPNSSTSGRLRWFAVSVFNYNLIILIIGSDFV